MNQQIVPWKIASSITCVGVTSEDWNLSEIPAGEIDVPRTYSTEVLFPESFNTVPVVQASLVGFDIDQRDSSRVSIAVSHITTTGFKLAVTTWMETRVYGVEASWLAIGS
ncbi:MAG: H-type lectin domain-containing protein [Chthoniobacteraceae bacterium]